MTPGSPWADPSTPTEPGPPYAGPPVTGPPPSPYAPPLQAPSLYGPPPYGWPPPGVAPHAAGYAASYGPVPSLSGPRPRPPLPGQVVAAAVLAFVQAAVVGFASLYVWFAVTLVGFAAGQAPAAPGSGTARELAAEGTALAVVGVLSAVLLAVGGAAGLLRRSGLAWSLLAGAHAVQVVLAAYWGIRLYTVLGDVPGTLSEGAVAALALVFATAPLVSLGLVLLGPGRAWFDGSPRS